VVLNAANEVAVAAFLDERVGFADIPILVERALSADGGGAPRSIEECVEIDAETRRRVGRLVDQRAGGR
jgi:1-deoxy-D-xylulose-5-phosphate reductoisomerase